MSMRLGNCRRGFTLVELIVAMSAAAILLALATGAVHRMMRFESASRQRANVHRTAVRLSRDFRHDVHRAERVELSDRGDQRPVVRLMLPDGDVTYQAARQRVLREQRLDERQIARETYDFPADYQVSFSHPAPRKAELVVAHNLPLVEIDPQTVVHIEAEVGRLLRLAQVEEIAP